MTTVTKHDLMLALLAMDSYNRGRDGIVKQLATKNEKELSGQIGEVTFQYSSDRKQLTEASLAGSTNAGFSASYYT